MSDGGWDRRQGNPAAMIAAVIPTLNAGQTLPRTLAALVEPDAFGHCPVGPVVVSDGGSNDDTVALAARAGAIVIRGPRGRGRQLAAGADAALAAGANALLFIHADSVPGAGWRTEAAAFIANPANSQHAAAFRFVLDDSAPAARRLERWVAWRCRALALPYGDQGLLIGAAFYRALGGYRPLELMEDVDLMRRVGRRRLVMLDAPMLTSAARYADGYLRRSARNLGCLALYFAGLPPRTIERLYR